MSQTSTQYQLISQGQGDSVRLATRVLEMGKDEVVSFAGTSQFTAQGVSACGLAAFNFARIGVRIQQCKKNISDVLNELSTRRVVEEIIAICAGWSSNLHLEVEEIHGLPIFSRYLKLNSVEYGLPQPSYFRKLLENMKKMEKSAVTIITRPPEIIACFKFANDSSSTFKSTVDNPVFVVFDSHPRSSHPHGTGLSFSTSIENTARTLSDILPTMDGMFDSSDYGWQAQLLANCSAHLYVAKHRRKNHDEAVVQSSLAILGLRAQISELKRENEEASNDNKRLESEVDRLRSAIRQEQMIQRDNASSSRTGFPNPVPLPGRSFGLYSHAVAGPSRTSSTYNRFDHTPAAVPVVRPLPAFPSRSPDTAGAQSIFADNPPPVPSESPCVYEGLDFEDLSGGESEDDIWIQSAQFAAFRLQNEFDSEDRRLRREHAELAQYIQTTFQCSICMDELPEDDVAKVEDCVHTMCRSCLRMFVASKIQEHRYPIFCPMCTIEADSEAQPAVISRFLVEQLGVSEEQSRILTEMELAEFSVQIHCRKCQLPAFVDREDYKEAINIVCPQAECNNVWCKKCEQTIVIDGPRHSCDGSSELAHLMEEKGWKHCPNCTTPILKESGCNHMMCISPGCNTHFCYICGCMIIRSALNQDINQAVSVHYRKCQLFEVPI